MRYCSLLILLVPLAVGAGAPSEDDVKQELQKFQGSWHAVSIQRVDGTQAPEDEIRNTRLVVKGNKFTLTSKDATIVGTFTIDPTRTSKTTGVLLAESEEKLLGIYHIEGDRRKSCFALPGKERPKDFQAGAKGYIGFEWKRQSP